jgi:hypothetical protein
MPITVGSSPDLFLYDTLVRVAVPGVVGHGGLIAPE